MEAEHYALQQILQMNTNITACCIFDCVFCSGPESPCRGEPVRDYHRLQRGGVRCQTSKTFSWVDCQGRCLAGTELGFNSASYCCSPLRVRRRKLSFDCDDGTTLTQDVEKPVECGCKECL